MDVKVKAVIVLMSTLGVSLDDVAAALKQSDGQPKQPEQNTSQTPTPSAKEAIKFYTTRNGMTYANHDDKVLGLVFQLRSGKKFVLSSKEYRQSMDINETQKMLRDMPAVGGRKWIVPGDEHFMAVQNAGLSMVNDAFCEIGGARIADKAYLSATSQANRPSSWYVRLILPL